MTRQNDISNLFRNSEIVLVGMQPRTGMAGPYSTINSVRGGIFCEGLLNPYFEDQMRDFYNSEDWDRIKRENNTNEDVREDPMDKKGFVSNASGTGVAGPIAARDVLAGLDYNSVLAGRPAVSNMSGLSEKMSGRVIYASGSKVGAPLRAQPTYLTGEDTI